MPQLGLTMETGTILRWLVAEGETVEKGKPIVLIQTDKVEYEVESPAAGTVLKVIGKEGAELPVGTLMAVLGQPGEDVSALVGAASAAAPAAEAAKVEPRAESRRSPQLRFVRQEGASRFPRSQRSWCKSMALTSIPWPGRGPRAALSAKMSSGRLPPGRVVPLRSLPRPRFPLPACGK